MFNKVFGIVLVFIGLYALQGALLSLINTDYPTKKALITSSLQLFIAIVPFYFGIKFFKAKTVVKQKEN